MSFDNLLIGQAGIADLAGVKRQVVTTWRRRFGPASADPFPEPTRSMSERDLFDASEVALWLESTNHGNNPQARLDAPAHAVLDQLDVTDRDSVDELLALIALMAITGDDLPDDGDALLGAARAADPHDAFLAHEIRRHVGRGSGRASRLVDIVDGFYAPGLAIARIERAVSRRDRHAGTMGALSDAVISLVAEMVTALRRERDADVVLHDSVGVAVAAAIRERDEHAAVDGTDSRAIRRFLTASGEPDTEVSLAAIVSVARVTGDSSELATALESVARTADDLAPGDVHLVVGPADALVDPLTGSAEHTRDQLLRSGALRAVARLPKGHVLSAVQQPLALWLLTHPRPAPGDHRLITADVSARALTPKNVELLVNDMLASVWPTGASRAFALASPVPARAIVAQRAALVGGRAVRHMPQLVSAHNEQSRPFVALEHEWTRGMSLDEVPVAAAALVPSTSPHRLPAHRLGSLVGEGHARVVSGTRLAADARDGSGFEVLDAQAIATGVCSRHVDALRFAAEHPNARLSQPGDVVFVTAPRPTAMVDRVGSRIVAYPARILRVNAGDSAGLVPRVVADDISRAEGASWRLWRVRRVLPAQQPQLVDALDCIDRTRDELRRRLVLVEEFASQFTDAVADGTSQISPSHPASREASHQKESA